MTTYSFCTALHKLAAVDALQVTRLQGIEGASFTSFLPPISSALVSAHACVNRMYSLPARQCARSINVIREGRRLTSSCRLKAKFHYTDTDTDFFFGETDPHGPNGVSLQKKSVFVYRARVRVRVVEFSYKTFIARMTASRFARSKTSSPQLVVPRRKHDTPNAMFTANIIQLSESVNC